MSHDSRPKWRWEVAPPLRPAHGCGRGFGTIGRTTAGPRGGFPRARSSSGHRRGHLDDVPPRQRPHGGRPAGSRGGARGPPPPPPEGAAPPWRGGIPPNPCFSKGPPPGGPPTNTLHPAAHPPVPALAP